MKIRNPIIRRILVLFLIVVSLATIIFFAIKKVKDGYNHLYFDLGEERGSTIYEDKIISSYSDYIEFSKEYKIKQVLKENDFQSSNYLLSFQDYDKCSEKKPKELSNITFLDDTVHVEFEVFNKCGWCKKHIYVYLIKLPDTTNNNSKIEYQYNFSSNLDCGAI